MHPPSFNLFSYAQFELINFAMGFWLNKALHNEASGYEQQSFQTTFGIQYSQNWPLQITAIWF